MVSAILQGISAVSVILLFSLGPVMAQDSPPVSGPVLGFVVDAAEGVRPVFGIPGGATLGRSVLPTYGLSGVVLGPEARYALAISAPMRRLVLLRNNNEYHDPIPLDLPPGVSRIVLSPSGASAAVYYQADRRVEVLTGLPNSASWPHSLEVPDFAGNLSVLAVNDYGDSVLAVGEGEEAPLFVLTPETDYRMLSTVSSSASVAFLPNSYDAVIADGVSARVTLVRDIIRQPRIATIGGPAESLSRQVAIAVARDGKHVFVANGEPAGVVSLSLSSGDATFIRCNCTPTTLEPLGQYPVFRLNDLGNGPLWIFDAGSSPPRIVFIPDERRPSRPTGGRVAPGRGAREVAP